MRTAARISSYPHPTAAHVCIRTTPIPATRPCPRLNWRPRCPRCEISLSAGRHSTRARFPPREIWRGTLCSLLQLRLLEISEQLCASWDSATGRPPHCPVLELPPRPVSIQAALAKTMRVPTTVTELCNKFPMESKCLKVSSYLLSLTLLL